MPSDPQVERKKRCLLLFFKSAILFFPVPEKRQQGTRWWGEVGGTGLGFDQVRGGNTSAFFGLGCWANGHANDGEHPERSG